MLEIRTPTVCTDSITIAHEKAMDQLEPIFFPAVPYTDDRGWSLMNLLTGILREQGQVNFSTQYPGVIKAWHRHEKQTDFWLCTQGHLKAGIYHESNHIAWVQIMGEQRQGIMIIPPPLWHGVATVGPTSAGLLYYVTHAYNPQQPDEIRRPYDSVEGFPWSIQHG